MTPKRNGPGPKSEAIPTQTTAAGHRQVPGGYSDSNADTDKTCVWCRANLFRPESIAAGICLTCYIVSEAVPA